MRMGVHKKALLDSLQQADEIYLYQPKNIDFNLEEMAKHSPTSANVYADVSSIVGDIAQHAKQGDHVIIMSNGGFESIHTRLLEALAKRAA